MSAQGQKRKAPLAEADVNTQPAKKPTTRKKASTKTASTAAKKFKYSDEKTLDHPAAELRYVMWSKDDDEEEEEEEQTPAERRKAREAAAKEHEEFEKNIPSEVTDKGYPISADGFECFGKMMQATYDRDQDRYSLHISNDWTGYGVTEVLENTLIEFNRVIFKKDVSPFKKWAIVEGLATWLVVGDLYPLMMNDDSTAVKEVFSMFVPMQIAAIEMLAEHNLINTPRAFNAEIITSLIISFLTTTANDMSFFKIDGLGQIVLAADKAGLKLVERKQKQLKGTDAESIKKLRENPGRKWDWKKEWKDFKLDHSGGKKYDIAKMSRAQKAQYSYGGEDDF